MYGEWKTQQAKDSPSFKQAQKQWLIDRIYVHKDLINYGYDNEVGMGQ